MLRAFASKKSIILMLIILAFPKGSLANQNNKFLKMITEACNNTNKSTSLNKDYILNKTCSNLSQNAEDNNHTETEKRKVEPKIKVAKSSKVASTYTFRKLCKNAKLLQGHKLISKIPKLITRNHLYIGGSYIINFVNNVIPFEIAMETAEFADTKTALTFKHGYSGEMIQKSDGTYASGFKNGSIFLGYKTLKHISLEIEGQYSHIDNDNSKYVELQRTDYFFRKNAILPDYLEIFRSADPKKPDHVAFKLEDNGLDIFSVMINIKARQMLNKKISAYVSIGAGSSFVNYIGAFETALGYQITTGLAYNVSGLVSIAAGYKFIGIPRLDFTEVRPIYDIPYVSDYTTGVAHTIPASDKAFITNQVFTHGLEFKLIYNF